MINEKTFFNNDENDNKKNGLYNNNNSNNMMRLILDEPPIKAFLEFLRTLNLKRLETCFSVLQYKRRITINRFIGIIFADIPFWGQFLDELEHEDAGTPTQFLMNIFDEKGNNHYERKYRFRIISFFSFLERWGLSSYETIDPKTHPDIQRHLNSTQFFYLNDISKKKYDKRYRLAIEFYKNAKSTLGESAIADRQRIEEAKNGQSKKKSEPEPEPANPKKQRRLHLIKAYFPDASGQEIEAIYQEGVIWVRKSGSTTTDPWSMFLFTKRRNQSC